MSEKQLPRIDSREMEKDKLAFLTWYEELRRELALRRVVETVRALPSIAGMSVAAFIIGMFARDISPMQAADEVNKALKGVGSRSYLRLNDEQAQNYSADIITLENGREVTFQGPELQGGDLPPVPEGPMYKGTVKEGANLRALPTTNSTATPFGIDSEVFYRSIPVADRSANGEIWVAVVTQGNPDIPVGYIAVRLISRSVEVPMVAPSPVTEPELDTPPTEPAEGDADGDPLVLGETATPVGLNAEAVIPTADPRVFWLTPEYAAEIEREGYYAGVQDFPDEIIYDVGDMSADLFVTKFGTKERIVIQSGLVGESAIGDPFGVDIFTIDGKDIEIAYLNVITKAPENGQYMLNKVYFSRMDGAMYSFNSWSDEMSVKMDSVESLRVFFNSLGADETKRLRQAVIIIITDADMNSEAASAGATRWMADLASRDEGLLIAPRITLAY